MKKISILLSALLSIIWTANAQIPTPSINGTPPPFIFTGGVSQTGQTFNFTGGSPGGAASGDLSGSYPAPLVTGLDGIPFINTPTPVLSDVICYDGVQYTPCPPAAGPAQLLYITNVASDISTYKVWDTTPAVAQFTVAASIPATNTKTLIQAFATTSGYPNVTVIPAGEWQADTYAQISSAANTTTMNIDVYKRTTGNVETLLFSFADISITTATLTHYTVESVEPAIALGATDRLVIKYSMTHNTGSAITGTVYGGGTSNYSHVHTPIGTDALNPKPSDLTPLVDGTAAAGTSALYSRGDHVHPTDTSRLPEVNPILTGNLRISAIFDPIIPTVAPTCSGTCATTWGYEVVLNGALPSYMTTAASPEKTVSNDATLDGSNFNTISAPACPAGVTSYDVYRTASGGIPVTIGKITAGKLCGSDTLDTGLAGDLSNPPTVNTTGGIFIPALKSTAGQWYLCIDSNGSVQSSAVACGSM